MFYKLQDNIINGIQLITNINIAALKDLKKGVKFYRKFEILEGGIYPKEQRPVFLCDSTKVYAYYGRITCFQKHTLVASCMAAKITSGIDK